ncbi:MAG: hypothetical protein AAFO69_17065 [Bacteroidota bacterium]
MKDFEKHSAKHPYSLQELRGYVQGTISTSLAAQIEADTDRFEELATIIEGIRYFEDKGEGSLEQYLDESFARQVKTIRDSDQNLAGKNAFFWRIAAAVALLVVSIFAFYYSVSSDASDVLAVVETHLQQPYEMRNFPTRGSEGQSNIGTWQEAYQNDQWQVALDRLSATNPDNSNEVAYYEGLCYLYLGKPETGLKSFDFVLKHGTNRGYLENARWFAALSHLKAGNQIVARKILQQMISFDQHYKRKEARELLDILED